MARDQTAQAFQRGLTVSQNRFSGEESLHVVREFENVGVSS